MARKTNEVAESLANTVRQYDPSIDLDKGPAFNYLVAPNAPEISSLETQMDSVRQLVSLQFPDAASETELNAVGASFGIPAMSGTTSSCQQTFFTRSRPSSDIVINRGVLVATSDQSRVYVVDRTVTMSAASISSYYNAARRRYEILVPITATAFGPDFDLPSFRIVSILTKISGIDGTENRESATGGLLQESNTSYFQRIQDRFSGLNPETGGGIQTAIREYAPNDITDINMVYPKDRSIFKRDLSRPAVDVYLMGETTISSTDTFVAVGGETSLIFSKPPVVSIDLVLLNGIALSSGFTLLLDTTAQTQKSARAVDQIVLTAALVAGDQLEVQYTYNNLVNGIQTTLFNTRERMFETDILIRSPLEVFVNIGMTIVVLQSFDTSRVLDQVTSFIFDYCESTIFNDELLPEVLRQNIKGQVAGVSSVSMTQFTPNTNSVQPIQAIRLSKNQISKVNQSKLSITLRQ